MNRMKRKLDNAMESFYAIDIDEKPVESKQHYLDCLNHKFWKDIGEDFSDIIEEVENIDPEQEPEKLREQVDEMSNRVKIMEYEGDTRISKPSKSFLGKAKAIFL